ncbi:MAG: phosphatidylglycerophosphatase A [Gemmatimonadota bacterium]
MRVRDARSVRRRSARFSNPAVLAATVLGLGRWPWGPGTLTSAAVAAGVFLVAPAASPWLLLGLGVLVAGVGIPLAGRAERELGQDHPAITLDEAAGMLISLAAAPRSLAGVLLAFGLFRVLDVVKPQPAAALQRLPGGLGVVADDVAAAGYAAAVLLVLRLFRLDLPWLFGTS